MAEDDGVRAARKTLRILEMLATGQDYGVTEISRATEMSKARAFRYLQTMVTMGYVVQLDRSDRYARGPRMLALARSIGQSTEESLLELARPSLQSLHEQLDHTVNLSIVYGDSVSILESLPGRALFGILMKLHEPMPLHCTAAGKLLLAERHARNEPLPISGLPAHTPHTLTEESALIAQLEAISQQGWAQAPEEVMLGINAVSVPIRDNSGELVAMLSVLDSVQLLPADPSDTLISVLKQSAAQVEARLAL
ncbi:IclR family transcriptional regulator [Aurantiacibacter poecillastricola]|uniref:IclR family transcriptional regulator n=1 Tax=Aurantiacibacter poecillastricola TaxID=3064385 RepID=UPI00273EF181|nr:IclR family transcriptional regulator [Aurantiacibacter sp. 219JJ12-13]MDP5259977.1 IclR family transcriptional regulator [Aurantiacibacter sp. 219JJ12-13]